jgi:hypothetical protein
MAENRLKSAVDQFKKISGFDLESFLLRFSDFRSIDYPKIVSFYSGQSSIDSKSFEKLDGLNKDVKKIGDIYENQSRYFATEYDWDLLDNISSIKTFLATAANAARWARSSVTNDRRSSAISVQRPLKDNEMIEDVELNDLGSGDHQNTWVNTAVRNDVTEEEAIGGKVLNVNLTGAINSFSLESSVDTLTGKNIYGKDIHRRISFVNDDINHLDPDATVKQTVEILLGLTKGQNFFSPFDGITKPEASGIDRASISFPSIFRQLANTLATDDSLKDFSITNIRNEPDAVFYDMVVKTRLGDSINASAKII